MYRFFKIVQRDTINLFINPMWLFFGLGFPLLLTLILAFLTEGLYGKTISSYDYYGTTMLIYSALYAATFSANAFLEERIKEPNLRIIFSPVGRLAIPLAKILATFLFTVCFYSLAALILHFFFQVNYGGRYFGLVYGLFLACDFLFSSIGVLMCCLFKSEGVANQILSLLTTLTAVLAGFFFPVASFGKKIAAVSQLSPVTRLTDTVFALIYDQDASGFPATLGCLLSLAVLIIGLCGFLFKGEDYL